MILVLKDNIYTQGIGLLEVLWDLMEDIIDTRIKEYVTFHDILHVF